MTAALSDVWVDRDRPVLVEACRLLDEQPNYGVDASSIAPAVGLDADDVTRALVGLIRGDYLDGNIEHPLGGPLPLVSASAITPQGRATVGLWPSRDAGDSLVQALKALAESGPPERRGAIRRLLDVVGDTSREVLADVVAEVIKRQTMS